jgi:hypothetical protein
MVSAGPESIATPDPMGSDAPAAPPPPHVAYEPLGSEGGPFGDVYGPGRFDAGCGDRCGDGWGADRCPDCGCPGAHCRECLAWTLRHISVFAGVQGFKGPIDLGRNGNFGFHEGINWGGPIGDPWGFGYQMGAQAVQSNFLGSQVVANSGGVPQIDDSGRDQLFVTIGVFNRALDGGLQGGVVFDYLHDSYYDTADLKQIRTETSLNLGEIGEVGFFGAFGSGGDTIQTAIPIARGVLTPLQPNDVYALFVRRHFSGGGQGRLWGGASGHGDGLVGAEATVPIGTNWALENNFVYLIPKESSTTGGQRNESWSVVFSLVWYPGRESRCVYSHPYTPLFGVADNSTFLIRREQ